MSMPVMIMILLTFALTLVLPRKYVIFAMIPAVFLIPRGEVLVLAGFHFTPLRLLALFGWARIGLTKLTSQEPILEGGINSIDKAFIWCGVSGAIAFVLLWQQTAAITNQIGYLTGTIALYFVVRFLVRDEQDIYRAIKALAFVAIINCGEMVYEQLRNQNLFGTYLGGVESTPLFRDGRIRSQGVFGHAILAGTFGATVFPLFLLLWKNTKAKILAVGAALSSVVMVYTSASSTSTLAFIAVFVALAFWPLRKKMRMVRWGIVLFLIVCHLVMKAPVWFLIAHMDVIGASSGYHRAKIVDLFIRNFFDWWLVGTKDIGKWGWDMWDLSNSYVAAGESGGFISFIFFIAVISRSLGRLGKARKVIDGNRSQEWLMWLLSTAVFAHVIGFFGISYWDMTIVDWYLVVAMVAAATTPLLAENPVNAIELTKRLHETPQIAFSPKPAGFMARTPIPSLRKEKGNSVGTESPSELISVRGPRKVPAIE